MSDLNYGGYRTVRELARSGLATVYAACKADGAASDKPAFAVKVFRPPLLLFEQESHGAEGEAGGSETTGLSNPGHQQASQGAGGEAAGSAGSRVAQQVGDFLEAAAIQQKVAATGRHWAPIHQFGKEADQAAQAAQGGQAAAPSRASGAFYASDLCRRSTQQLIAGKIKLDGAGLYALVSGVAAGLVEFQQAIGAAQAAQAAQGPQTETPSPRGEGRERGSDRDSGPRPRPHGNLKPTNILITSDGPLSADNIVLADPLPTRQLDPADPAVDLRALGQLIHQLVLHRPFRKASWPLGPSKEWAGLGSKAEGWRQICNQLLSDDPADGLSVESLGQTLARLRVRPSKITPGRLVAAAVVAIALAGAGVFAYRTFRPEPPPAVHEVSDKWHPLCIAYADWFGGLQTDLRDPDRQAHWSSDPQLAGIVKELRATNFGVEPRRIIGDQSILPRDLADMTDAQLPPEYRATLMSTNGRKETEEYWSVVQDVETHLRDWPARRRLTDLAGQYDTRSWPVLARVLRQFANDCVPGPRATLSVAVERVLTTQKDIDSIENHWESIVSRQKRIRQAGQSPQPAQSTRATEGPGPRDFQSLNSGLADVDRLAGELERGVTRIQSEIPQVIEDPKQAAFLATLKGVTSGLSDLLSMEWDSASGKYIPRDFSDGRKKLDDLERLVVAAIPKGDPRLETRAAIRQLETDNGRLKDELGDTFGFDQFSAQISLIDSHKVGAVDFWSLRWQDRASQKIIVDELPAVKPLVEGLGRAIAARDAAVRRLVAKDSFAPSGSAVIDRAWVQSRDTLIRSVVDPAKLSEQADQLKDRLVNLNKDFPRGSQVSAIPAAPSAWDSGLAARLLAQKRDEGLQKIIGAGLPGLPGLPATATAKAAQAAQAAQDEFNTWATQVVALAADFSEIEAALNGDYGLDEPIEPGGQPGGSAKTVKTLLDKGQARAAGVFAEFKDVLRPVSARVEAIGSLASLSPAELARVATQPDDPAVAFNAWRTLGRGKNAGPLWPASVSDLNEELQIRDRLATAVDLPIVLPTRRGQLKKELAEQSAARWKSCFEAVSSPAQIDGAVALMGRFGVSADSLGQEGSLSPTAAYNFALHDFVEGSLRAFSQKAEKVSAVADQRKMLTEFQPQIDAFVGKAARQKIVQPAVAKDQAAKYLASLEELKSWKGEEGDSSKAGPAAVRLVGVTAGATAAGAVPKKVWFKWKSGPKEHSLEFVQVAPGDGARPALLSADVVSVELFRDVLKDVGKPAGITADELHPAADWSGPRSWNLVRGTLVRNGVWLCDRTMVQESPKNPNEQRPYYPPGGKPKPPGDRSPMQYVPPKAAIEVARLLGCRLPTAAEWAAAYKAFGQQVPANRRNLRDATWKRQQDHVAGMANLDPRPDADWPDAGIYWPAGAAKRAGRDAEVAASHDDGVLWFADVDSDPGGTIHHLVGNVAEYVYEDAKELEQIPTDKPAQKTDEVLKAARAAQAAAGPGKVARLGVIGGSALSPPQIRVDQAYPVDIGESAKNGYADVGFRLAFTAPEESLFQRTQSLLDETQYLSSK